MYIPVARFRETVTSLIRWSLMSGKKMRFKVPPKTFRLDGRITQRISQWVPNRQTGDWESPQVPKVLRRNRGIFSLRLLAERRCWRPENWETGQWTGTQQSATNFGVWYRRHRWTGKRKTESQCQLQTANTANYISFTLLILNNHSDAFLLYLKLLQFPAYSGSSQALGNHFFNE